MPPMDPAARRQLNEQIATLTEQGRFTEALPLAREACAEPADPDPGRADSLEYLGVLERELGHYAQAEAPLLQALSLRGTARGKEDPIYARTLSELARLYEELAQYNQAEPLFRRALG